MLSDFKISDRCANGWTEFPATGKFLCKEVLLQIRINIRVIFSEANIANFC